MRWMIIITTLALAASATPGFAQRVVKEEPPIPGVREGERLFVDDGSCPAGQIKLIIGGSAVKHVPRSSTCVARPAKLRP